MPTTYTEKAFLELQLIALKEQAKRIELETLVNKKGILEVEKQLEEINKPKPSNEEVIKELETKQRNREYK